MRFWYLFLLLNLTFVACSSKNKNGAEKPVVNSSDRAATNYLSESDANLRSLMATNVEYDIHIHLKPEQSSYKGRVQSKFNYSPKEKTLTIDFLQGKILSLRINGIQITNFAYNNYFISIESGWLKTGENIVDIEFEKEFSKNGSGFYKFTDPIDQKSYFYTDFEPYNANSFIPCFDQPDIKATYRLSVEAPKNFKIISGSKGLDFKPKGEDAVWTFRPTQIFSTYVMSLHAGPYYEWTDRYQAIPLKLYARQSIKNKVEPKFWFDITKKGFKYFETYFNYPYPFEKYDQVIVPDFNSGAMENVGAVTFSEKYCRDGNKTAEEEERLANVILHEMSHMWFGNLVTMKWWNGLWLNESFASFMAVKALHEATQFKQAWMTFYDDDKAWAYYEDDLSTTHPIESSVLNTDEAFNNFDGITYGKGAAVLKQLNFYLGDEAFKKGMQNYFRQYQFSNTQVDDFLGALANSSGKNMQMWSDLWLKTTGFDRVAHHHVCEDHKIKEFFVEEQASNDKAGNRFHATKIGFYYLDNNLKLRLKNQFDVTYQVKSKLEEASGLMCPDLVWLNQDDYDYVRVVLDEKSLFTVKSHLSSINDPLTRSQLWTTLWDMVRDAKMKVSDYLVVVKKHLPLETELKIKLKVLETIPESLFYLKDKGEEGKWFEEYLEKNFKTAKSADEKKTLYDQLLKIGRTSNAQKFWLNSLSSKDKLNLFDQNRRWETLIALAREKYMDYQGAIEAELKRDPSDDGKKYFMAAQVSFPTKVNKEAWLSAAFDEKKNYSLAEKKNILKYLFPPFQTDLKDALSHRLYDLIPVVLKTEENEFIEAFGRRLAPLICEAYPHKNLVTYLEKKGNYHAVLKKAFQMNLDEDTRCLNIRNFSLKEGLIPSDSIK